MPPRAEPLWMRFDRLTIKGPGCWLWTGGLDAYGYGQVSIGHDGRAKAHRLAFEMAYGPPSDVVRHTCDVRRCVRPEHLLNGTQAQNMADAVERSRLLRDEKGRWIGRRILEAAAPWPTPDDITEDVA